MGNRIPVTVTVESRQTGDDESTVRQQNCRGYLVSGQTVSLTYREESEEGEKSYTTLTREGEGIRLHRAGALQLDACLVPGQSTRCVWGVPPYSFDLELCCHVAEMTLSPMGGRVLLDYDRLLAGDKARLTLDIRVAREEVSE
ncbi:MAG: DUF1934 domain-containing protein [Clostridia bacterium]|nr:DUF1934 domain-containing protein [Clostridia bacterium]